MSFSYIRISVCVFVVSEYLVSVWIKSSLTFIIAYNQTADSANERFPRGNGRVAQNVRAHLAPALSTTTYSYNTVSCYPYIICGNEPFALVSQLNINTQFARAM